MLADEEQCYGAGTGMCADDRADEVDINVLHTEFFAHAVCNVFGVIAYAPCINHGIKGGMGVSMNEEKKAVAAGYWHTFRFDPRRADNGENPFQLDSKKPSASYRDFIMGEVRYNSLTRAFPQRAEQLFEKAEKYAEEKYEKFAHMASEEE